MGGYYTLRKRLCLSVNQKIIYASHQRNDGPRESARLSDCDLKGKDTFLGAARLNTRFPCRFDGEGDRRTPNLRHLASKGSDLTGHQLRQRGGRVDRKAAHPGRDRAVATGDEACGKSSRGEPSDHSRRSSRNTVSPGSGARRAAAARAAASESPSGPSITMQPPRSSMSAARSRRGLAPRPSAAPANARIKASGVFAPTRLRGQMPQPGETFGEQARAGRGRSVMGVPGASAGNVGGVAGRQVDAALAVAEQAERLGREPPGRLEVAGIAARLEQRDRRPGHGGVIVQHSARARAPVPPGVQEPSVRIPQRRHDEREGGAGRSHPFGLVEDGARPDEGRDRKAVPVRQNLVVAAGPGAGLAQREELCTRKGEVGLLFGRASRRDRRRTVRPSQLPPGVTS